MTVSKPQPSARMMENDLGELRMERHRRDVVDGFRVDHRDRERRTAADRRQKGYEVSLFTYDEVR